MSNASATHLQVSTSDNTPYAAMGGEAAVRRLVDRFYDYMDELTEVRRLREMHAKDLGPMRQKLFEFMSGWLGGPPLYFQRADAKCLNSAHRPFAIDAELRDQWMLCMSRALSEIPMRDAERQRVNRALWAVTEALRNR